MEADPEVRGLGVLLGVEVLILDRRDGITRAGTAACAGTTALVEKEKGGKKREKESVTTVSSFY